MTYHVITYFLLVSTARLCCALSDTEGCDPWKDMCPNGMYCSTTSFTCYSCQICGHLDVLYSKSITKCVCDGGKDGDMFAICPIVPPAGYTTRGKLIQSMQEIPDGFKDWGNIFNGSFAEMFCQKENTTTIRPSTAPLYVHTTIETEAMFRGATTASGPESENLENVGGQGEDSGVHANRRPLYKWLVPVIVTVCLLVFFGFIVYWCCHSSGVRKGQTYSYAVCRDSETSGDIDQGVRDLEMRGRPSLHLSKLPASMTSESEVSSTESSAVPVEPPENRVRGLCTNRLNGTAWTTFGQALAPLLADDSFRRPYISSLFPDDPDHADRISLQEPVKNLLDALREETETFGVDNYEILGATLAKIRATFPEEGVRLDELLGVLLEAHQVCCETCLTKC